MWTLNCRDPRELVLRASPLFACTGHPRYAGKTKCLVQHARYLTRCSRRSRNADIQELKSLIVIHHRAPKPVQLVSWDAALEPISWPQLRSAQGLAMSSSPSTHELAELSLEQLRKLVSDKFNVCEHPEAVDDDVAIVSFTPAPRAEPIAIDDGDDDELFDIATWDERAYEKDTYQDDTWLGGGAMALTDVHEKVASILKTLEGVPAAQVALSLIKRGERVTPAFPPASAAVLPVASDDPSSMSTPPPAKRRKLPATFVPDSSEVAEATAATEPASAEKSSVAPAAAEPASVEKSTVAPTTTTTTTTILLLVVVLLLLVL